MIKIAEVMRRIRAMLLYFRWLSLHIPTRWTWIVDHRSPVIYVPQLAGSSYSEINILEFVNFR